MPINIYDTRTMLAAIEMRKPVHTFLKDTFFSTPKTFTSEHVDVDYYKGRRRLAPFVSSRVAGKVMDREGFTTKTFKPASIKPMRIITGDDINKRSLGENIYSAKNPDQRAAELLAQDLSDIDEAISRREEWMVSQILFTGQVEIKGEGIERTLDFDFTNKTTLSGTALWSDAGSDPIANLKQWRTTVIQNSGITPDRVIMASDVVDSFIGHEKVKDVMDNRRIVLGQINPTTLPNGVTYIGSISSLGLDIYSYDEWYFDEVANSEQPMIPSGKLMLGSTRARSSMLYGAVTLTNAKTDNFTTYEGERIPDSWIQKDPAARFLQIHSRPLPVPHEVDSWYVATVL
ncbi:major capsid protein [Bacillus solitudinis]|uniref:major capsid protein n=1 Tax=Bacillus solitudinis TaxID=2014074 RepID=UPI000C246F9B|nr:major capsid protein [Bacillus solitudinis]